MTAAELLDALQQFEDHGLLGEVPDVLWDQIFEKLQRLVDLTQAEKDGTIQL